jgi:nicotinate-nucleotide adenylyltransferase
VKTGLLFGSFNPVHTGHLIIAEHFLNEGVAEEVWLVVSPHNPFKDPASLAPVTDRLAMARIAVEQNPRIQVCDIELSLPTPSYTAHTLRYLFATFPDRTFTLIIGEDNLAGMHGWKDSAWLLSNIELAVFPRSGSMNSDPAPQIPHTFTQAPLIGISSTAIRDLIRVGKSVKYLVPERVELYIVEHNLYSLK